MDIDEIESHAAHAIQSALPSALVPLTAEHPAGRERSDPLFVPPNPERFSFFDSRLRATGHEGARRMDSTFHALRLTLPPTLQGPFGKAL